MEVWKFVFAIIGCLILITGFIITITNMIKARKKEIADAIEELRQEAEKELNERAGRIEVKLDEVRFDLAELKNKVSGLETKTDLFWRCIESNVGNILKSFPSNLPKDVLLTKMIERKLSLEEAETLREILDNEMNAEENTSLRFAYILALAGLAQTIHDKRKDTVKNELLSDDCK